MQALKWVNQRFEGLSIREQWIVFFAGFAVIWGLLSALLLDPVLKQRTQLQQSAMQREQQIVEMQQQMVTLSQTPVSDPNAANRTEIIHLKQKIALQKTQLARLEEAMVTPTQMPAMLKALIQDDARVHIVSMKTIDPIVFPEPEARMDIPATQQVKPSKDLPGLYRHGLEMTLSGRYMDLMAYAEKLEKLSGHVLWDSAALTAKEYPISELTLRVYTLSLDKTWLSI